MIPIRPQQSDDYVPIGRPLLRWLGGKWRLAPWIISHFPPHRIYIEPFGGAASVLLRKPRAYNEIYNDLDDELVNLFQVLRSPDAGELLHRLRLTPYARAEYLLSLQASDEPIERARRLVVRSHMAHGTSGARHDRSAGFRVDGQSGTTNVAGEWADFPDVVEAIIERTRGVSIQSKPALDLIASYDTPKALIYLDPPYMPSTRSTKSSKQEGYHTYWHELSVADHEDLLAALLATSAMVVLSGYPNEFYDQRLAAWRRVEIDARAHRNSPRVEVLWINPSAQRALGAGPLFGGPHG